MSAAAAATTTASTAPEGWSTHPPRRSEMFHWMHQNGGPDKLKIADVEAFLSTRPWWKNRSHMLETYNGMSLQTKRKFERMYDGTKYAPSARKHISSEFKTRVAFMKCVSRVKAGRRVRRDSKFAGLTKAHVAPAEAAEHKGPTALDEYIAREFPAVLDSNAESDFLLIQQRPLAQPVRRCHRR
jgi:hypothetical protein